MIMLGIDPGCRFAGFGILKKEEGKAYLMEYGCLSMNGTKPLVERVGQFHQFFEEKIISHAISNISLETPFMGKNAQNFLKLGYLRGIIYLLAHKHQLVLHEFSPTQVKQTLTGFGGAPKEQVAHIVTRLFPKINSGSPLRHDVTDALAVTLCGVWQHNNAYAHALKHS